MTAGVAFGNGASEAFQGSQTGDWGGGLRWRTRQLQCLRLALRREAGAPAVGWGR